MALTRKPSIRKNTCPVCCGTSVSRNDKVLGYRAPKFNCPDCGTGLTTAPALRILWGFAAAAVGIPAAFLLSQWLQSSFEINRTLLAGIYAGLIGGASSLAFALTIDGLVFK